MSAIESKKGSRTRTEYADAQYILIEKNGSVE
jgi:hypothetical protein